ncbi:hypothetical protein O181_086849 [Austropuccinia psidii MF-1]|uniref:Uncharacterized protein n=1 Tax=Austropuccinia psidii MF-1 TaxID=1389203 RepID=A0A9Q3INK9_9BASI|nr:hypothetical protein [Austropuccinia psidii MF-1]
MPSTRSGAGYNPSSSSQKGHRRDYGRGQSVTEEQGSVDDLQINKLCHSEADNTILPSNRTETATRILSGHIQSQPEGNNNALQHKEYQILVYLWKDFMNSYLTVRKFLGHPNTCKLLNGWHPLMEKKNMMHLTPEWRKNNPPPPKQVPKTAPVASSSKLYLKKAATSLKQGPRQGTSHKILQPGLKNPKCSAGCNGKCTSEGQNNDGITEKGGSRIKISEMISDILYSISEFYEAINDIKTLVSDKT